MGIADELQKLDELHRNGTLTDEEFAQAKTRLLTEPAAQANPPIGSFLEEQLANVSYQNDLARLDREWDIERRQYEVVGRYGRRYIPTTGTAFASALVGLFGVIFTGIAIVGSKAIGQFGLMHPPNQWVEFVLPGIGIVFTLIAIGSSFNQFLRSQNCSSGYARYQARRQERIDRHDRESRDVGTLKR